MKKGKQHTHLEYQRKKWLNGLGNLSQRVKVDTYDLMLPILSMPEQYVEFHDEKKRAELLEHRENLLVVSKAFLVEIAKVSMILESSGISMDDMEKCQRMLNEGSTRKLFIEQQQKVEESLSFLKKYRDQVNIVVDEEIRSATSEA